MVMILHANPFPSSMFTVTREGDRTILSAEASDFNRHGGVPQQRIFDDAVDVGIFVESTRTNNVIAFSLNERHVVEGDVQFWRYLPISEHVHRHPDCANVEVVIFND